ncbi:MAG: hypothetical protein IKN02_00325 [Prevotella sp.]|nr:hypothetical protein [Prevotella sp.]
MEAGGTVVYKQIVPLQTYPFPWSLDEFFGVFPETRLGQPPSGILPIDFTDVEDADLVIVVGQSWFLSPSLPLQSFFTDRGVMNYLSGRPVIFMNVCRNMWLMTIRKVKGYLAAANAQLVGHIVLQDEAPNLISVLTIVRWLIHGRQEASGLLPRAGVSSDSLASASRFGEVILGCGGTDGEPPVAGTRGYEGLQDRLLACGAIHYKPSILFLEKAGHRMFGFWATFIQRKGGFGDVRRRGRARLFYYYLLVVLFVVSSFAQLFFYLTYPLQDVARHRHEDCGI